MENEWIDKYCISKNSVKKDFKVEWGWHRYLVGGKMFSALCTHKNERPIITLKCEPSFATMLRANYEDIIPGYYMNKEHWNTVYLDGKVPDNIIKEMISMSYKLVLGSLTKKMQKEIHGGETNDALA